MIDPQRFFQTFLQQLGTESQAYRVWNKDEWTRSDPWTKAMTAILVQTTREVVGRDIHISAKGFPDKYDRKEYLTLDVCAYDDAGWSPPLVIAEHENNSEKWQIQSCAWKLLCIEAQLRVLVAYADPKERSSRYITARDSLRLAVEEVRNYHQKPILVIAGEWPPENTDRWREQDLRTVFIPYLLSYE